MKIGIICLRK
jgi:hypothetical protein